MIRGTRCPCRPPPPIDSELVRLAGLLRHPGAIEPRSFAPRDIPGRNAGHRPLGPPQRHPPAVRQRNAGPSVAESFPPGRHDSRVLWVPGANHHTTIADLPTPDRTEATTMLTRWAA
ncbi:hypothetical protein [Streptomyces hirsutus]|uniref:hypothetical protein n=1 Tax=Streptomyces hirsutus TaxID=35620 RepID=UPI0036CB9F38